MDNDVISLAEVAKLLGETYPTVWGWATGGRIPAHKVGWACGNHHRIRGHFIIQSEATEAG
jgi:excisionase family DNA binding protein